MNLLENVKRLLGLAPTSPPQPSALRQAVEAGRRAKHDEDYPAALELFEHALTLIRAEGAAPDNNAITIISLHQGDIYTHTGRWEEAEAIFQGIVNNGRSSINKAQVAYALNALGVLEQTRDHWTEARGYFEQALTVAREAKATGAIGRAMGHLAHTYLQDGNASYAIHLLREALPHLNVSGDIELSSYFVGLLGEALIAGGQDSEGEGLLRRALRLADHMQYRIYQRKWRLALAEYMMRHTRFDEAYTHFQQAIDMYFNIPPDLTQVTALSHASEVALRLGEVAQALVFARRAAAMSVDLGSEAHRALAEGALGTALRQSDTPDEALPYLQQASDIYRKLNNGSSRVKVLRSLGAALSIHQADAAETTLKEAISVAQKYDNRFEEAQARHDLGLFYNNRGQRAPAITE